MVEEPAMLIMRSNQQRTVPFGTISGQQAVNIAQKIFAGTDRRGWMVVVGVQPKWVGESLYSGSMNITLAFPPRTPTQNLPENAGNCES